MTIPELPADVADTMVHILFREDTPFGFDDLLIVGPHTPQIAAAVTRFAESEIGRQPTLYTTADSAVLTGTSLDATELSPFLQEGFRRQEPFDYVLGTLPPLSWNDLNGEQRREIAGLSRHVSPDDTDIPSAVLFLDRAESLVASDGRVVTIGATDLKTDTDYGDFRRDIGGEVRDVEAVDENHTLFEEPTFVLAIEPHLEDEFAIDDGAMWADPRDTELQLSHPVIESHYTVQALMTPLDEMIVYQAQTDDAAKVYLDLLYQDYEGSLVFEDATTRDGLVGYVARAELRATSAPVSEQTTSLTPDRCIAPDASLVDAVRRLADARFLFPGTPEDPHGILTRYDLNRLPMYQWLYGQLARFEISLRDVIRNADWSYANSDVRLPSTGTGNLVPDRLANASLNDLITIIRDNELERSLLSDIQGYRATLSDIVELRNHVAHYNVVVHTMTDRPTHEDPERNVSQLLDELELMRDVIAAVNERPQGN